MGDGLGRAVQVVGVGRQLLAVVCEPEELSLPVVLEARQLARDVDLPNLVAVPVILQGRVRPLALLRIMRPMAS